ncbi:hypothetical protein EFN63_08355 [Leuconostoc citreum]|nr:hypothetical protein [Leuconostoc citreum]MCT3068362.1 hypothetical protein [Leuconostoc citreum]TDG65354.1 hypothetical protein C5L21_000557 [Leuconostoc citreum]GDZ85367.1 hypothetical protein LCTS_05660 [Leuconostoc citreum]
MQQGHPRHKQLSKANHEMIKHNGYMFVKKILDGMVKGIVAVGEAYGRAIRNLLNTSDMKPLKDKTKIKDSYIEMHNPKGLIQVATPNFSQ